MAKKLAYGPLCANLNKLKQELKVANAELAGCKKTGMTSEEQARVDDLKDRIRRCDAHMLGLSHGMKVCCTEAEGTS